MKFLMHSPNIARKGFAYLIGHSRVNQVTPNRLSKLVAEGFYLSGIQIVSIKAWFGRYYFLIFSRSKNEGIGYSTKNYSDEPLRHLTPPAPDRGESAPLNLFSTPEVDSDLGNESNPAPCG